MTAARVAEHALLEAVGELAETGAWEATGHRSLSRFVEELWRVDPGHGKHLVQHAEHTLATVTLTGQAVVPRLPRAAALCAAGEIGEEHLRVLVRARDKIGRIPGIEPGQIAEAQEMLAEAARSLSPCGLERVVTRLLDTLDADGAAPEEEPEPTDELLLTHRRDGTLAFTGRIHDAADVDLFLETLDALATPAGPDDPRDLAQRRAEALLDLCGQARGPHGIADPDSGPGHPAGGHDPFSDDPPGDNAVDDIDWRDPRDEDSDTSHRHGRLHSVPDPQPPFAPPPPRHPRPPAPTDPLGSAEPEHDDSPAPEPPRPAPRRPVPPIPARAQIAVTIPLEWLREQTGHAQLDSDRALGPAAARRLACDANIIPVVLGTHSEPIELGRATYVVTEALRRLLVLRDRGCAHPGCTRRANRTHAHHIHHWSNGGHTELNNLVLLCRYHHHLVHHGGWEIQMIDGRPWFTPPHWTDPQRRPIPGGATLPPPRQDAA
jgi:hypothetical protein